MRGIFLGLGSNCGDCVRLLRDALFLLEGKGVVTVRRSSVYETEAVLLPDSDAADLTDVQNYLNAVIEVETDLSAHELLGVCDEVERALGRVRGKGEVRWGARTIDIDILVYGNSVVGWQDGVAGETLGGLIVPHPLMHKRNFVLVPFAEIADEVIHPILKKNMTELLRGSNDIHRVSITPEGW